MLDWRAKIIEELNGSVSENEFWKNYLDCLSNQKDALFSIHLAIFVEPFLKYVLTGKKTIETRFSAVRCAPFEQVRGGDVVLLKKSGGNIIGICQIRSAWFYRLEKDSWSDIKKFAGEICAESPEFWEQRKKASYATLMRVQNVHSILPIKVAKRDRRGWVVINKV